MLQSIQISSFKSFKEQSSIQIEGRNGIVAIEGPNGSGKSTLLSAVSNCLGSTLGMPIQSFYPAGQTNTTPRIKLVLQHNSDSNQTGSQRRKSHLTEKQAGSSLQAVELTVHDGRKIWKVDGKVTQQQHLHESIGFVPGLVRQQTTAALLSDPDCLQKLLVQACKATSLDSAYRSAKSKVSGIQAELESSQKQMHHLASIVELAGRMNELLAVQLLQDKLEAFRADVLSAINHADELHSSMQQAHKYCLGILEANAKTSAAEDVEAQLEREQLLQKQLRLEIEQLNARQQAGRLLQAETAAIKDQIQQISIHQSDLHQQVRELDAQHQRALSELSMLDNETNTPAKGCKQVISGVTLVGQLESNSNRLDLQFQLLGQTNYFAQVACSENQQELDSALEQISSMQSDSILQLAFSATADTESAKEPRMLDIQRYLFKAPALLQSTSYQMKQMCRDGMQACQASVLQLVQQLKDHAEHVLQLVKNLQKHRWHEHVSHETTGRLTVQASQPDLPMPPSPASEWYSQPSQLTDAHTGGTWGTHLEDIVDHVGTLVPSLSPLLRVLSSIEAGSSHSVLCACVALSRATPQADRGALDLDGTFTVSAFSQIPGFCGQVGSVLRFDPAKAFSWQTALEACVSSQQLKKLVCDSSQSMEAILVEAKHQQTAVHVLPLHDLHVNMDLIRQKRHLIAQLNAASSGGAGACCPIGLLRTEFPNTERLGNYLFQNVVFVASQQQAQELLSLAGNLPLRAISRDGTKHQSGWLSGGCMPGTNKRGTAQSWIPLTRSELTDSVAEFSSAAQACVEACARLCKLQQTKQQLQQFIAEDDALFTENSRILNFIAQVLCGSSKVDWEGKQEQPRTTSSTARIALEEQLQSSTLARQQVEDDIDVAEQQIADLAAQLQGRKACPGQQGGKSITTLTAQLDTSEAAITRLQSHLAEIQQHLLQISAGSPVRFETTQLLRNTHIAVPSLSSEPALLEAPIAKARAAAIRWNASISDLLAQSRSVMNSAKVQQEMNEAADVPQAESTATQAEQVCSDLLLKTQDLKQNAMIDSQDSGTIQAEIDGLRASLSKITGVPKAQFELDAVRLMGKKGNTTLQELNDSEMQLQDALSKARVQLNTCNLLLRTLLRQACEKVNAALTSFAPELLRNFKCCVDLATGDNMKASIELTRTDVGSTESSKAVVSVGELSGGQQTLASLAVLLAVAHIDHKPLYLFDEIDAALDEKNRCAVARLVRSMFANKAMVLLVSHHRELQLAADQTVQIGMNVTGSSEARVKADA